MESNVSDVKPEGEETPVGETPVEFIPKVEEVESDDPDDVTREGNIVVDEQVELYDKDEEIITKQFYEKNITQVTSSDLVNAGIEPDRMHPTRFTIGRYEISRQIMISKFTIKKLV
jgi:hypothetical protein